MNRDAFYILKGRRVVECKDFNEWIKSRKILKTIRKTLLLDGIYISTIFLGRDHSFSSEGPPMVFETTIFGGRFDQRQERYPTYQDAVKGHKLIVKLVKKAEGYIL